MPLRAGIAPPCLFLQAKEINGRGGEARPAVVDVTVDEAVAEAFQQHLDAYGKLQIVCLNAGVLERGTALEIYQNMSWHV